MTPACILALAISALPAGALGATEQRPLLFIPDQAALDWAGFHAAVSSAAVPFTAALAPAKIPASELPWLKDAVLSGRLELALRLEHDPLIILFTRQRPRTLLERLVEERAAFRTALGAEPMGFVAAGAVLDPAALRILAAQGFFWTAAGQEGHPQAWRTAAGIMAVPFRPAGPGEDRRRPESGEAPGAVLDETAVLNPGQALPILQAALKPGGPRWTTVYAHASLEGAPVETGIQSWPAWAGAGSWLDTPAAQRARELFNQAYAAVERYQNSGAAALPRLEAAGAALNRAAAAVHFRPGASLAALMADLAPALKAAGESASAADGKPSSGSVTASPLSSGVAFEAGARASTAPWLPLSLSVERQGTDLSLTVTLAGLKADTGTAVGFSGILLEVYIDVNGLAGSGATRLLGDRRARVAARDAWEFAVTVDGKGAALWRVGQPVPSRLQDLAAEASPEKGEIHLSLPVRRLRGNPASWGFLTLTTPDGYAEPAGLLGATAEELPPGGPPPTFKAARLIPR